VQTPQVAAPEQSVAVRTLHVLDAEEAERVQQSVHCPKERGTVGLAACASCPFHHGVRLEDTERASYVRCGFDGPHLPKRPAAQGVATPAVDELMTRSPVCVREDVSSDVLTTIFVERGISGAPVVDADGHLLGMVTITDLVKDRYDQFEDADSFAGAVVDGKLWGLHVSSGAGSARRTAGELMTPGAVVITEGRPASEAAALMARHRVKRLPVVDDADRVVGVLSSLDLMRWMGRQAGFRVD